MELVVIWICGALVAGVIGDRKGRSGGWWALAALAFSPLVVLIVLALPSLVDEQLRAAAAKGRSRTHRLCPECGELIRIEARRCRHCQSALGQHARG